MKTTIWACVLGVTFLAGVATGQSTQPIAPLTQFPRGTRAMEQDVRARFDQIERIARMTVEDEVKEVPALYRDVFVPLASSVQSEQMISSIIPGPKLLTRAPMGSGKADYGAELESVSATMTVQEVADKIVAVNGRNVLHLAALERLKYVLLQHRDLLTSLIDADLAGDDNSVSRAFWAINQMRMREYLEPLTAIIIAGGPRAVQARNALGFLSADRDAAKALLVDLEKNPGAIVSYKHILRIMLFNQPADPTIVKLLDSPVDEVRAGAALVLEDAENSSAVVLLPRLLSDAALDVRLSAQRKAFRLPTGMYFTVQEQVLRSLESAQVQERADVAILLANKNMPDGAKVLLECLKDPQLPIQLRGRVRTAATRLMNSTGGGRGGPIPTRFTVREWDPSDPVNAQEIAAFELWIKQHVDSGN